MHQACIHLAQAVFFALCQVDGMAIDPARAQEAMCLVGVKVIARRGIKIAHPGDFVDLLAEMGLHQAIGVFCPKRAEGSQLIGAGGWRKPRRDHIRQSARAMPALQQRFAVVIGRLRAVLQACGGVAVHAGFAGIGAQPTGRGGGKEGLDALRVDGGVAAHRGGAMRQRQIEIAV